MADVCPDVHRDPADVVASQLALAGVQSGPNLEIERLHRIAIDIAERIARCGPSKVGGTRRLKC